MAERHGVSSDLIEHLSHFERRGDVGLGAYARRTAAMRRKSPRLGEIGDREGRHGGEDAMIQDPAGLGTQLHAVSHTTGPVADNGVPNESAVNDVNEVNVSMNGVSGRPAPPGAPWA